MPSRIELLRGFMTQRPDDPFPHYALALEYKNAGDLAAAWETFSSLLERHGDYVAAYLHAGNTLVALGRPVDARSVYERGLAACVRKGDTHAHGELAGALASLG
jgi:tetratricopeptide (TPR) repeat protein